MGFADHSGCVMQTVAAILTQLCFDDLDGPPVVIGLRKWITPAAELKAHFFPQPGWPLGAIHERILPFERLSAADQPDHQQVTEALQPRRVGVRRADHRVSWLARLGYLVVVLQP